MSSRPDIELALDVRSYEGVVVVTNPESDYEYPVHWIRPYGFVELQTALTADKVVIVDRVELSRKALTMIAAVRPRLVAFAVQPSVTHDHEKAVRRLITGMFPWNDVWTISTSFGKLLVTKDILGEPYDRDALVDMRNGTAA